MRATAILVTSAWAAASPDAEGDREIRELFREIWEGEVKGDFSASVTACAPDLVACAAFLGGPASWTIEAVGIEGVEEHNRPEAARGEWHATWAKPTSARRGAEVLRVQAMGDRAIAVTQKRRLDCDPTAREDIYTSYKEFVILTGWPQTSRRSRCTPHRGRVGVCLQGRNAEHGFGSDVP